jgi:RHS repeat-associated protein
VRTGVDQDQYGWSFVHAPGIDNPIMGHRLDQPTGGGSHDYLYFVTDGSSRQLAVGEASGADFTNDPTYFGRAAYAGGVHESFGFSAARQPTTEIAGLSFFRNRWYDQRTGRWTQEDPIGLAGGVNLYQYVGNNPASYTDPFGLCKEDDATCQEIVRHLRRLSSEGGDVYDRAANIYDEYDAGYVYVIPDDQPPLGYKGTPARAGRAPTEDDPNFYLKEGQTYGEFIVTAVHEAFHIPLGGHSPENQEAFYRVEVGAINGFPRAASSSGFGHYCTRGGTYGQFLRYQQQGIAMPRPRC